MNATQWKKAEDCALLARENIRAAQAVHDDTWMAEGAEWHQVEEYVSTAQVYATLAVAHATLAASTGLPA